VAFRKHTTADGKAVYLWRGKVPVKEASGAITYKRVERSTKSSTLAGAREAARKIEAEYHERAGSTVQEVGDVTFADAALGYMKSGGERRYLAALLSHVGNKLLTDITQDVAQQLSDKLKPGASVATINRHIFTPLLAVLNYAAKLHQCPPPLLIRPKGHDKAKQLDLPDETWFAAILPHLSPKARAVVLVTTLHGLRIAEAIERTPDDVDAAWRLHIPDTKTGEPVMVPLSEPVIEAIKSIPGWRRQKWLFGTCHRSNIAKAIRRACKLAGVQAYGSHAIGRHSFATRVLVDGGKSLKFLMQAGRWKTAKMPMSRYGHLEHSEVNQEVNQLATKWADRPEAAKVTRLKKV